jgi:hypothetical protein
MKKEWDNDGGKMSPPLRPQFQGWLLIQTYIQQQNAAKSTAFTDNQQRNHKLNKN